VPLCGGGGGGGGVVAIYGEARQEHNKKTNCTKEHRNHV